MPTHTGMRALLTRAEAADLAGVTPWTIDAWVRRGLLTRHVTPAGPRYRAGDIAYLAGNPALRDSRYSATLRTLLTVAS